jgi:hypothetical protein
MVNSGQSNGFEQMKRLMEKELAVLPPPERDAALRAMELFHNRFMLYIIQRSESIPLLGGFVKGILMEISSKAYAAGYEAGMKHKRR